VCDGRCVTVDGAPLRAAAAEAGDALLRRAGVVATSRWPLVRPSDHC
jgi:hypothetical protein